MRFLAVLVLAAVGAVLGAIGGFFTSVFLHPEASPAYTSWGLFAGMAVLLWVTGSFGDLLRGAFRGALGAMLGAMAGWILSRVFHHDGQAWVRAGAVLGALLWGLRTPRAAEAGEAAVPIRTFNPDREEARKRDGGSSRLLVEGPGGDIIPYQSDGKVLGIQQLMSELTELAPESDLGSAVVEETTFMAADREYVEEVFYRCLARRMAADGIVEWTESKFDCDDFANYLKNCANLAMLRSRYKGATHGFFVATVRIATGNSLLGVRDGLHANNLVRCTDGNWYFIEPQMALRSYAGATSAAPKLLQRFPAAEALVRRAQGIRAVPSEWMCPATGAIGANQGGVELLAVRF